MRPTLLVFTKYPEPGSVKTRLAAVIGPVAAAELYRRWIAIVFNHLQPLRSTIQVVGYFDGAGHDAFREWHALADDWWPQPAGDLGNRLGTGITRALRGGGPVLAIGTDCLEIGPALIEQALAALSDRDVVFGPTSDGGYYLVGTSRARPGLFESIRWSSSFTLADHLARCRDRGWTVACLPELRDIDTWDDWQAYLNRSGVPQ